ncbi:hypothetical protein N781_02030 [Pontibacillus halophilus JSM 076056 = DSM 19796]|uniref:L,D-TPase catalytic domain-containing protein n=1 Tax=Pontibacillus halophilus JSM 076056 = DSM 19796 TaxID=1385510 RepID=A0A0A5IDR3_9BACI|nr:hypothetical protein N781_02030 [Pontibacillus halophilus JSM 076056 = DSM 19796]
MLVTYPVASGPKPPPTSTVLTRVVEPLGSNGAYGSKALALEDGYAIHGTNDPSSIGSYETGGCLRMHDADIDNLFSYVAIGTPFISEPEGLTPPYATFGKSLPTLAESDQQSKQEKSELSFSWKH